ncbi:MAG: ATP-dependent 6-phosphofructokinase [Anaerolineae bacterium]
MSIKRIAINTGGGDAPGLNAVIRAIVLSALNRGWECVGIRDGYNGLLTPDEYPQGGLVHLDRDAVRGITHLGGTILGTTNKGNPLRYPTPGPDGQLYEKDRTDELVTKFGENDLDALIAIGGDGSLAIAHALCQKGLRVIGVPKTIDNDLDKTVITFGFDTAVNFATDCIDRLHSTAEAHRRIMVVEVMGRYAGWIALNSGTSGTAEAILIPEIPYDINVVAEKVRERGQEIGRLERLGGAGEKVAAALQELTGKEARTVVLGHLQRGGTPSTFDRLLSLRFGAAAVRALNHGQSGIMVALDPPTVNYVPLDEVAGRMKTVPLDCDTILTARDLGISFGDS